MALLSLSELREMSMTYSFSLQMGHLQKETETQLLRKGGKFIWGYLTQNDEMEVNVFVPSFKILLLY